MAQEVKLLLKMLHDFVVNGKGMKMSKSMGNVVSPDDILKNYGADILRIWVAASDYAEDLRIDKYFDLTRRVLQENTKYF